MLKKITPLIIATIALTIVVICIFKDNNERSAEQTDDRISGAYEALNMLGMARTYPDGTLPATAHYDAWKKMKSKTNVAARPFSTPPWESMGPHNHGGRTLELAFNPQNANTLYAGSASGGLWRSYSAGVGASAWEYVETGFPILGVSSIAFAPGDSMTMYIGTGEVYNNQISGTGAAYRSTRGSYGMGILKSTDGGKTWDTSLDWTYDQSEGIWDIKVFERNSNTIYTATTDGVYKSTDAGATWFQVLDVAMANSLIIHPDNGNIVLVGCGNFASEGFGIYKTTDGGASWTKITSNLPDQFEGKIQLEQSISRPNVVYASIGNGFSFSNGASWLCRSNDFGSTWSIQNTTDYSIWQGWFSHDVAINPTTADEVIAIGISVWKSTDGGVTLDRISQNGLGFDTPALEGPDGPPDFVHSDCHDVIYHPNDPNIFYVASDGGIHRSLDGGASFHSCNGGYESVQFYNGFSNSFQDSIFCIGGLQDNGTIHWEGGKIWTRVFGGDGSWTAIDPLNDNNVFVSYQNLNIFKSTDRTESFSGVVPPSDNENTVFIAPFVIAQKVPSIMYAARSRVYKTFDGGENWIATNNGNTLDGFNPILSMDVSAEDPNVVYAASAPTTIFGGVRSHAFVTTDGGNSWTDITNNLPDRFPMDITVDPTDPATAYIVFSGFGTGHVYKTTDYGASWRDVSGDLPDVPTNAVIVDPLYPSNVYVGNDLGVFVSTDGGESWESYQDGMYSAVMIFDLKISPVNRKLRAATHGNGAFQRELLESGVSNTSEIVDVSDLQVFPNPAVDIVNVKYELENAQMINAQLTDINGRLIQQYFDEKRNSGKHQFTLDVSDLSKGTYVLRIQTDGAVASKKIVVVDR